MTGIKQTSKSAELSPTDLYNFIASDSYLQREVLAVAKSIVPYADSLIAAMLVLGYRTIKEITMAAVIDLGINSYAEATAA